MNAREIRSVARLYSKAGRTAETSRYNGQQKDSALRNAGSQINVPIGDISRIGCSRPESRRHAGDKARSQAKFGCSTHNAATQSDPIKLSSELTDRLPSGPPYQVEPSKRRNRDCKHKYKLPELSRHYHGHSLLALTCSNFL